MKRHLFFVYLPILLLVPTLHSWNGEDYDNASDRQFEAGLQLLKEIKFQGDERVLDLGCGTCRLAAHIAQHCVPNGSVVAVDNSESMIQKSLEKQANSPIDNLTIELKDACALDYHEEFDLVVSVFCLHWIRDLESMEQAIKGIARSLKPGGKFCAVFNIRSTDDGPIPISTAIKNLIAIGSFFLPSLKKGIGNNFTLDQYRELLRETNLEFNVFSKKIEIENFSEEKEKEHLLALPIGEAVPQMLKPVFLFTALSVFQWFGFKNADGTYNCNIPCGFISAEKTK
jgi:ubiquinone/menaquinone biosynthesis C-methylase UbiE